MTDKDEIGQVSVKVLLSGLMDFRFHQYLTMQLLPVFYALLLLAALLVFAALNALAFWLSPIAGMVMLAITPLALILVFAVIRAALEFLVMAYRIMQTVHSMDRIPGQVDNLNSKVDGISDDVDTFKSQIAHIQNKVDGVTDTISFLNVLSAPGRLSKKIFK